MKIILAIKSMSISGGGTERVISNLSSHLVKNGYEVGLLTFDPRGSPSFYPIDKRVTRLDIGIGNSTQKTQIIEGIVRALGIRKIVREWKPDMVVGFMHSMYVPLAFSLVGTRIPVIASEHIVREHYKTRRFEYFLVMLSSLFISQFTMLSTHIRDEFWWGIRRKAIAIPNPVEVINNNNYINEVPSHEKIILSVGRLDPQKDQITLIRAFAQIADTFPEWHLRIIGDGHLRNQLEFEVNKFGLNNRIALPGATSEIYREYQAADIFILPSRYESFGLATAEAMGHGLPVIGFADCPGTNELIRDKINGLLIDPSERVENLAKAMKTLMTQPDLRMFLGEKGKESIQAFSPNVIYSRWESLLQEVYKNR